MWLGAEYGLLSYVDNQWKTYTKKDGMSATWVYFLWADKKNTVWALTKSKNYNMYKGLSKFNGNEWTSYTKADGILWPIYSINDPDDGNIWFGGLNKLYVFDGTNWTIYTEKDGLLAGEYRWIIKDKNQNIWASNNKFLLRYNSQNWTSYFKQESSDENWKFNIKHKDSWGDIWLGTKNKGLYKLDGDEWINFNNQNELGSNWIKQIFEDKQGNIWFITGKGLSVYRHI